VPFWYWVEEGAVQRREATGSTPPADIAAHSPQLLKRTELGDNDAGVRLSYVNYTKRTQMLEKLRHYRASTYERLMQLHADFSQRGPLHEYVRTTFGLSEREFRQVQKNLAQAAGILQDSCSAGRLRFDIDPEAWLRDGRVTEKQVDCGPRA
jgi:hypothetical protein